MSRPVLEVADIFRDQRTALALPNVGHVRPRPDEDDECDKKHCRTAALGGHVARCKDARHVDRYNSCRSSPSPEGARAAKQWLAARERPILLPVPYFHVVFTLPAAIADIAYSS